MFWRCFFFLFYLFAAPQYTAAASTFKQDFVANPALWKISQGESHIYLFGTVHILPEKLDWMTASVRHAFNEADMLVVETLADVDVERTQTTLLTLAFASGAPLPPLADRIDASNRAALQSIVQKSGVPMTVLDQFHTWAATLILSSALLEKDGMSASNGVDQQLIKLARSKAMTIHPLETADEQLMFYHNLPEAEQRLLLDQLAASESSFSEDVYELISAWAKGDTELIKNLTDKELNASPILRETLLKKRNAQWVEWIKSQMAQPRTLFVAVGSAHLIGADSVPAMLKKQGITAVRLQ